MKIGFIQTEEKIVEGRDVGFIETVIGRDNAEMTWPSWALMVFLHFCIVQVILSIVKELFHFFFMR